MIDKLKKPEDLRKSQKLADERKVKAAKQKNTKQIQFIEKPVTQFNEQVQKFHPQHDQGYLFHMFDTRAFLSSDNIHSNNIEDEVYGPFQMRPYASCEESLSKSDQHDSIPRVIDYLGQLPNPNFMPITANYLKESKFLSEGVEVNEPQDPKFDAIKSSFEAIGTVSQYIEKTDLAKLNKKLILEALKLVQCQLNLKQQEAQV